MNNIPLGYDSVEFPSDCEWIKIIDQSQLPNKELFLTITSIEEAVDAIIKLKVRGAPALGVFTAACIAMLYKKYDCTNYIDALLFLDDISDIISSARPTAVNSKFAAERVLKVFKSTFSVEYFELERSKDLIANEAHRIKDEDIDMSLSLAQRALTLLKPKNNILTYCNAGHLATARYGTALAPIYLGNEKGYSFRVYVPETRPLLQGSRLTAYELSQNGVDVTLICDNMVSTLMRNNQIDAVLTGCDRIAANGDVANKIGTSSIAVLANHYNVPFYVLGPESTIDNKTNDGNKITIEERDGSEITDKWFTYRMAPNNINTYNPSFDITDSELITAIITDKGIYKFPYDFSVLDK